MNAPKDDGLREVLGQDESSVPTVLDIEFSLDPFGIFQSLIECAEAWALQPAAWLHASARLAGGLTGACFDWCLGLGRRGAHGAAVREDERFSDPLWSDLPPYALLRDTYLTYTHWLEDSLFRTPLVEGSTRRRAAFWARQWLNAIAPTNFLLSNPVALHKAWESDGQSLLRGLLHFTEDLQASEVQLVDKRPFRVGENLANTTGAVVLRNRLVEVIQYAPTRARTHATPIVMIAPWINKFYILDLNEKKSLVRYLVDRGFNVFVTSWKNPGSNLSDATFDDYMTDGVLSAIDVAREICRSNEVHGMGYCLGGTTLAATMAWLNRDAPRNRIPVSSWTLLTTLVDFARPGSIEVFLDERSLAWLDRRMEQHGYLDGKDMARSFQLLRSNSLLWHYYVHRYLYGEPPTAFDILYWNSDSTRMPRAMHSFYLREFYLNNRFVERDGLTLAGRPIDLRQIRQPLYMVGCQEDHITPWKATFALCDLVDAPVRYVLTTSGHILGIVNPPMNPPKRGYFAGEAARRDPVSWLASQARRDGSWWEDWTEWLSERCGPTVAAPNLGSARYPALCPAPGTYVHEA